MRLFWCLVSSLVLTFAPFIAYLMPGSDCLNQPAASAAALSDRGTRGYCRYATIHDDQVVFASEDDLWTVNAAGGMARRLTAGKGVSSMPRISPDGKQLAYVCTEEGNPEVYIMPAEGGPARRLTHMGGGSLVLSGWSPDGRELLFASNARGIAGREMQLYSISAHGGNPQPLNLGDALTMSLNSTGGIAIGRNNTDPARWKRYRGGTAGELWNAKSVDSDFRPLISLKGNLVWPLWLGNRIYFLSDHEGVGNIYSCKPDGSDLKRHTNELEYYARYPSTDGKRIVYTAGAQIHLLDPSNGTVKELEVLAPSNITQAKRKFVEAKDYLYEFTPHPKGHSIGLICRGNAYTMPLFEGAVVGHGSGSSVRYEKFDWLPDGEGFVVVTDKPGYQQIEIHKLDESSPPVTITDSDYGQLVSLQVAPQKHRIAFANQKHDLFVVDYDSKKVKKIDNSPAQRLSDFAWSPDGKWIAYSYAQHQSSSIIRIADVETGATHDVTTPVRFDWSPCFDSEGKYLYFLSGRDYQPVRDEAQFDWSFPMSDRPFVITLRKDLPSPLVPRVRPFIKDKEKEEKDNEKGEEKSKEKKATEPDEKKKVAEVKIDFDGIAGRVIGLPVELGHYKQIASANKGRILYTRFPVKPVSPFKDWLEDDSQLGVLAAYDLDDQKESVIEKDVNSISIAGDHQTLVYESKKKLRVIDAMKKADEGGQKKESHEPGRESGWLDLGRVKVMVEPDQEWLQMLREAWRLQKENFWVEDMSKVDWELVRKRYEALLPLVRSRSELSDLIWEMQGELGTSHAYEFLGDYEPAKSYRRGFLGADLAWDPAQKAYRVDKIYRGDSWVPESDSPLAEPGANVQEGDFITAVGGTPVSEDLSVDELLVDHAGDRIQLTVLKKAAAGAVDSQSSGAKSGDKSGTGTSDKTDAKSNVTSSNKPKQIIVKTLKSEAPLRYRAWVEANRKFVHEMSKGQLGYLHIPDMGPAGFSEFHRGYLSEYLYPGMVVDVRYNGGGNVSCLLLEKLMRKRIAYGVPRWGQPEPYPYESVGGPLVAVTNQFAGSDGDIFSHSFQQYKLGPLVGKRTWGGVIGINTNRHLVDGTITTQPQFAFWFSDVGWKVENYGVDPDYPVEITPQDYKAGRDPQLSKAVELGLASLRDKPFHLPQFDGRPAKSLPAKLISSD